MIGIRTLLFFCAVPLACPAQYLTTNDGSKLFFITSNRLTGTNESFRSKLFSWDAVKGVQLVYESPTEWVANLSITGDGLLAAFQLSPIDARQGHGVLLHLDAGQIEPVGPTAIISRNGRYLFTGDMLVDRVAGTSRSVSIPAQFVGSDGSMLYTRSRNFHRVDPDGTDHIFGFSLDSNLVGADDNATMAVLSAPGSQAIVNTITGQQTNLQTLTAAMVASDDALLSSNGQWVAFQAFPAPNAAAQINVCPTDATGCVVLTAPVHGLFPIALSGDAKTVYGRYSGDRILKFDVATGLTRQAFADASLFVEDGNFPLVPGSLVRLEAPNTGDHITVNGLQASILSSSGGITVVQIPWELTDPSVMFTASGGDSPFETFTRNYTLADFFPQGFASDGINSQAYRQDWSATTYDSPAAPDEIVHIYAVDLGATECGIKTGQPAPVDRLCRITHPAQWSWTTAPNTSVPAEVLFAGLAPGLVGLYQIDVRVPPFDGYEFIELAETKTNPRVAFARIRQTAGQDAQHLHRTN